MLVRCHEPSKETVLKALGFRRALLGLGDWQLSCDTDVKLADVFAQLRDADFRFAAGPAGWPPAAAFEELRSKGLLVVC